MDKRVLLVDAEPAFAERAVRAFADADVALEAVDEARALDRAKELRPDLVILSERPDGNAFALCNRLRRAAELASVRVAILVDDPTGDAVEVHSTGAMPADLYLGRPADADQLLGAVGSALGLEIAAVDDDEILAVDAPDEELDALRADLAENHRALDELGRTVLGLQEELLAERERGADLEARLADADARRVEAELALALAEAKLADADARAKSLSEVLDDSLAEREDGDRAWTARLAEAESAAAMAREEADRARVAAAEAQGEAEVAKRDAAEARAEAESARAAADAARIEAIEARGEAEAAAADVAEGHRELEASRAEADELSRALAAARESLAAAEHAVPGPAPADPAPAADVEALARELAAVRADRERMQDELAAELSKLAHDLAVKDGELGSAKRRTAQLEATIRTLAEERERLAAAKAIDDPDGEIERLRAEVEELRGENEFLGTEVDRYAARVRELRREGDPG